MTFTNLALLVSLLVTSQFFYSSSASVTNRVSSTLLGDLCRGTMNFQFCMNTLGNYPGTGAADMEEVGSISIILATEQARENKYVVHELLHNEMDPVMKGHLGLCLIDYDVVLVKLEHAYRLTDKKDYKHMIELVNDAMKMTNKCEDHFRKLPIHPCPIEDQYQKMVWLNNIALVILDVLDG